MPESVKVRFPKGDGEGHFKVEVPQNSGMGWATLSGPTSAAASNEQAGSKDGESRSEDSRGPRFPRRID